MLPTSTVCCQLPPSSPLKGWKFFLKKILPWKSDWGGRSSRGYIWIIRKYDERVKTWDLECESLNLWGRQKRQTRGNSVFPQNSKNIGSKQSLPLFARLPLCTLLFYEEAILYQSFHRVLNIYSFNYYHAKPVCSRWKKTFPKVAFKNMLPNFKSACKVKLES